MRRSTGEPQVSEKSPRLWHLFREWARFSFGNAKAFSDFVGFHVRALFCITLALVALFPSIDAFIQAEAAGVDYVTPYSSWEGRVQVAAFILFISLSLLLFLNILRSVSYCFVSRPYRTGNSALRLMAFLVGIPLTLGVWVLELASFLAIIWRVFMTMMFALIATDAERETLNEKLCIIKPFAERTGLPIYPEPNCAIKPLTGEANE